MKYILGKKGFGNGIFVNLIPDMKNNCSNEHWFQIEQSSGRFVRKKSFRFRNLRPRLLLSGPRRCRR